MGKLECSPSAISTQKPSECSTETNPPPERNCEAVMCSIEQKLSSFDARLSLIDLLYKEFQALRELFEFSQQQVASLAAENKGLRGSIKSLTQDVSKLCEENGKMKETLRDAPTHGVKNSLVFFEVSEATKKDIQATVKDFLQQQQQAQLPAQDAPFHRAPGLAEGEADADPHSRQKGADFKDSEGTPESSVICCEEANIQRIPDVWPKCHVKEEAPDEQSLGVEQQELESLYVKEEEEDVCSSLGVEQLIWKKGPRDKTLPDCATLLRHEKDGGHALFSQRHRTQGKETFASASGSVVCEYEEVDFSGHPELQPEDLPDTEAPTKDAHSYWDGPKAAEPAALLANSSLSCAECGEPFNNCYCQRNMAQHNVQFGLQEGLKPREKAKSRKRSVYCTVCGKGFTEKAFLNRHMRTHTGEKPFGCDFCGRKFSQKSTLERHIRIHTGEKPFGCVFCDKRFRQKSCLHKHMRTHTGEKQFCCDFCGLRFGHKEILEIHKRKHSGQKPFSCDVCGQKFGGRPNLIQHKKTHSGEKPFFCGDCGHRFSRRSSLKHHMRLHTGSKQPEISVDC